MTKKVLLLSCVLGLMSAFPAHASPTNKKITISCGSGAPDTIIGEVDVTLYDKTGGSSLDCGLLVCDSSNGSILSGAPPTNSKSCTAPFRVYDMSYTLNYTDYDGNLSQIDASNNGPVPGVILKGYGFSTWIGPAAYPADTVTLDVK